MVSLSIYINNRINESGNAVTANRIPAWVAPKIYEEIRNKVQSKYDVDMNPLGSLGKKADDDTNGDIDIAIDFKTYDDLLNAIKVLFPDCEHYETIMSKTVSIAYPYNIDGIKDIAQVDFMLTHNIKLAKFYWHSPDMRNGDSKYGGMVRSRLLRYVISEIDAHDVRDEYFDDGVTLKKRYKYTFNTEGMFYQLLDYVGKKGPLKNPKKIKEEEKFITNDPDNIARFLFGADATIKDCDSAEILWENIHNPNKFTFQDSVAAIEKRFMEDDEVLKVIDKKDFPTKYYEHIG